MCENSVKMGYIDVADPRLGPEHHATILKKGEELMELMLDAGVPTVSAGIVVDTEKKAIDAVREIRESGVQGIIIRTAWFLRANVIARIAEEAESTPCMLLAITNPNDTAFEGMALSHGALDELGIHHQVHFGDADEAGIRPVVDWAKACYAKKRFNGAVYGEFGGQCLEMIPGRSDPNQLRKIFGIHCDTMEQMALAERAENVPEDKWRKVLDEWRSAFKSIQCDEQALIKSAKIYVAGHEIFKERDWAFAGIQCQPDMLDGYLAPCLPVAMWKEDGFVVACENDVNNALGMYLAQSITNKPSCRIFSCR